MAVMGRPPIPYDEAIADFICEKIADGRGLVSVLKENEGLPSYGTIMKWCRENPDFLQKYTKALEDMADHDADRITDVAEGTLKGKYDPAAARVAIDAFKWSAGKRRPKKYGDKLEIEQSGSVAVTHTLDVSNLSMEELDALEKALGRNG